MPYFMYNGQIVGPSFGESYDDSDIRTQITLLNEKLNTINQNIATLNTKLTFRHTTTLSIQPNSEFEILSSSASIYTGFFTYGGLFIQFKYLTNMEQVFSAFSKILKINYWSSFDLDYSIDGRLVESIDSNNTNVPVRIDSEGNINLLTFLTLKPNSVYNIYATI